MLKKKFFMRYFLLLTVFICSVFFYGATLLNMQFANAAEYQVKIHETYTRTFVEPVVRGEIFDRNGEPLVVNKNTYNLTIDGKKFKKANYVAELIDLVNIINFYHGTLEPDSLPVLPPLVSEDGSLKYSYSMTAASEGQRAKLNKFLIKNEVSENITAEELVTFLETKYKLDQYMPHESRDLNLFRTVLGLCYDFDRLEILGEIYGQRYTLCKDISKLLMTVIKENAHNLPGVEVLPFYERIYKYPTTAPHIIGRIGKIPAESLEDYIAKGYLGDETVGIDGVEKAFEYYLRGSDGIIERTYDKETGNLISESYRKEPVTGKDVYLTIDIKLQQVAEYSIVKTIDRIHVLAKGFPVPKLDGADANAGACAIINPNNGEVLALATYPSYDISTAYSDKDIYNALNNNPDRPFLNRATQGQYAPGSVFKITTAIAALCNGNIKTSDYIYDKGKYTVYEDYQPACWIFARGGVHGWENVSGAITDSCNYFFYVVGERLKIQKLNEYSKHFGLGVSTGLEIGESTGNMVSPESKEARGEVWVNGDMLRASIGQLSTYTPLQITTMLGTVLNGGNRYKNHLLLCVKEYGSGKIYYESKPEIIDSVNIDESYVNAVRLGMKNVIELGTASSLFNNMPGLRVGGKTGTVQVSNGTSSENATFAAFAPYEKPDIAMSVIIEKGARGTWAGYVAEDVFAYHFGYKSFNESMGLAPEAGE